MRTCKYATQDSKLHHHQEANLDRYLFSYFLKFASQNAGLGTINKILKHKIDRCEQWQPIVSTSY